MSDVINQAVEALNAKLGGESFDSSVKVEIKNEGALIIDSGGARVCHDD